MVWDWAKGNFVLIQDEVELWMKGRETWDVWARRGRETRVVQSSK